MARNITNQFLDALKTGELKPILKYVQNDDTLDMELRGDSVMIYYRGGKILTVKDNKSLIAFDENYLLGKEIIKPSINNLNMYFQHGKHAIDYYVLNKHNHLWEKEIQQRIVQENNYSPNSLDTDFFIIDMEYQDIGRADIVALQWDSTSSARRLVKSYFPTITIIEVKQGISTISRKSGIYQHWVDFNKFKGNAKRIEEFKTDMITVFEQKRQLGLFKGFENYVKKIDNCNFIYANPMGYGLYSKNIVDKQKFIEMFLEINL